MLTSGASASYAYDVEGRRIRKNVSGTTTEYFYSGRVAYPPRGTV